MNNELGSKYIIRHKGGGYQVQLWLDGKHHYIGLYKTLETAILERDKSIKKLGIVPKYNNIYFDNKIALIFLIYYHCLIFVVILCIV